MNKKQTKESGVSCETLTVLTKIIPTLSQSSSLEYFPPLLSSSYLSWGDWYCFVFSLFFSPPSLHPIRFNPMVLTISSEYWAPNLPGHRAATSELESNISIFARLIHNCNIILMHVNGGVYLH